MPWELLLVLFLLFLLGGVYETDCPSVVVAAAADDEAVALLQRNRCLRFLISSRNKLPKTSAQYRKIV